MSLLGRVNNSIHAGRLNADIHDELAHHAELRRRDGLGIPPEPGLERSAEAVHDHNVVVWLETWLQDARQALRLLRRNPGFSTVVVLSLALGIGANAAIFSLLNTVLLKTLPVPQPQQIYQLSETDGINVNPLFSYPVLQQLQSIAGPQAQNGAQIGAWSSPGTQPLILGPHSSVTVETDLVSGGFFPALGIQPLRGRWINANDNRAIGASPVAVLSYAFWQRQFAGDSAILGRTITLHGVPFNVIGIAPQGFDGLDPSQPVDLWAPLMMQSPLHATGNRLSMSANDNAPWAPQEGEFWLFAFARLPQSAQSASLAAALSPPVAASLHRLDASHRLSYRVAIAPFGHGADGLRQDYGAPLQILMLLVALMLVIALANVATLMLARMVRRRREIAIRLAIGISRTRLARQLLTEALVLSAVAAAAAIGVAWLTAGFIVRLAHDPFQPDMDWRAWVFLAAVALASGLLLGLLPAWQATRGNAAADLKSDGLSVGQGSHRVPLGRILVIAQIAFSLLLVAAAGLFSRSLAGMFHLDLGFDSTHIFTARVSLPDGGIPQAQLVPLQQQLLTKLSALPGVRAVALDQSGLDNFSADTSGISLAGRVDPPGGLNSNENTVSQNFFQAVGMTLMRGRNFADTDTAASPDVVIVNQAFARRFYPGEDPMGKTFGYNPEGTTKFHIIGVVADARVQDPHNSAVPLFYRLMQQSGNPALTFEVRTAGSDPSALASAVRNTITGTDSRLRIRNASAVTHRLGEMLQRDRLVAQLSGGFGGLALAIACLGLFGVTAYAVNARRVEFGVRLALGAARGSVLSLVLREAGMLLGIGVLAGVPLLLLASRAIQPLLPGIAATDPLTLAVAALAMAVLPLLAAVPAAWRAARTDPATALRAS